MTEPVQRAWPTGLILSLLSAAITACAGLAFVYSQPSAALVGGPGRHGGEMTSASCLDCHVPFAGTPSTRCLGPGCHGELATGIPPRTGPAMPVRYHVAVRKVPCTRCHREHRGNPSGPVDVHAALPEAVRTSGCVRCHSARGRPDHARTDEVSCVLCHGFSAWTEGRIEHGSLPTDACELCHEPSEAHPVAIGGCQSCHGVESWSGGAEK